MAVTKILNRDSFPDVKNWTEYDYLFDLITVEKRSPYLQGFHPDEEFYPLLRKIAESEIKEVILRNNLISLLEESDHCPECGNKKP